MTHFPAGFTWGAATSAHQTEGNNSNTDWWQLENAPSSVMTEPSLDACDSFHRYAEDIALLASAGLTSYRFSVEWARIEPTPGTFSQSALQHYQRMIDTCHEHGVEPVLTLHHFTSPAWLRSQGGWTDPSVVRSFGRYAEVTMEHLAGVRRVCTINEPNMIATWAPVLTWGPGEGEPLPHPMVTQHLVDAHLLGVAAARAAGAEAGLSIAMTAYDVDDTEESAAALAHHRGLDEDPLLAASREADFIGVQAYTRRVVRRGTIHPHGHDEHGPSARQTTTGWNYSPTAIGDCLRRARELVPNVPLLVTENGIATRDDDERIAYTAAALHSVHEVIAEGADVRGYWHWSLLDNFEWVHGYGPTFGLVAVDRQTFVRTPKPSLGWLGNVAKDNSLPSLLAKGA